MSTTRPRGLRARIPERLLQASLAALGLTPCAGAQVTCIFCNIPGQPTAQVPGLPGIEFRPSTTQSPFGRPFSNPAGSLWGITARITAGTAADHVVLIGSGSFSALVTREGTNTPFNPGRTYGEFDERLALSNDGRIVMANNISGATTDDELVLSYSFSTFNNIDYREGNTIPGAPPGVLWGANIGSHSLLIDSGGVSVLGQIAGAGVTPTTDFILYRPGNIIARKGITIPGGSGTPWENFDFETFYSGSFNQYIVRGDDGAPSQFDQIAVVNNQVILREGTPIPSFETPIAPGRIDAVYMAPHGSWIARGVNVDPSEDWVVGDQVVRARQGAEITPLNPTGERFSDRFFPNTFFISLTSSVGDWAIGGYTDNPNPQADEVIAVNDEGVAFREGEPVDLDGNGQFDDNVFLGHFGTDALAFVGGSRARVIYVWSEIRDSNGNVVGYGWVCKRIQSIGSCAADFNGDGFLDFFDVDAFISCFETGNCPPYQSADFNGDEFVDFFDMDAFISAFEAGC